MNSLEINNPQQSRMQLLARASRGGLILAWLLLPTLLLAQGGPAPVGKPDTPNTTFSQSHSCGVTTITRQTNPPTGVVWYWQTGGATTTGPTGTSFQVTSAGTYYLQAYNGASDEWSDFRQSVVVSSGSFKTKPATPSVVSVSNNCGNSVLTRSSPPSGVTWYWQSSSGGTSTSNSSSSVTRTTGSTYYLRARHSNGCWSDNSRTVSYSIQATAPVPNASVTKTYNPGSTMMTRNNPTDPLHEWFWQLSSTGTQTGTAYKGVTYTRTSGTVIYLRARHKLSGCWSAAQSIGYAIYNNPITPPAPTVTHNCGTTVLTRATPPAGETWYWQDDPNATNTNHSASTVTLTPTTEILNNGQHFLRARNNTLNFWSVARTIDYTVYQTPSAPAASDVNVCWGEDVQLTASSSGNTLHWYTESSGGTALGTGGTLDLTNVTADTTYYVEARNAICTSARTAVNVNVPNINYRSVQYEITSPPGQCGPITIGNTDPLGATFTFYFLGNTPSTTGAQLFSNHQITSTDTYYFAQYNGSCYAEPVGVYLVVGDSISVPLDDLSTNTCGPKTLKIQTFENQSISWPHAQPDYIGDDGNGYSIYQLTTSGDYTYRISKTVGCTQTLDQGPGHVDVTLVPTIYTLSGGGFLTDNPASYRKVNLRASEAGVNYKIFDGTSTLIQTLPGGDNIKSDPLANGTYTVEAHRDVAGGTPGQTCMALQAGQVHVVEAQTEFVDRSFSASKNYKVPKTESELSTVTTSDIIESITYLDDKGRPVQSIMADAAPDGRDLIQHMDYDAQGRREKSYLPFAADYNRIYHTATVALSDQQGFYTTETGVAHDTKPFGKVAFDGSPLNRVIKATGVGNSWHSADKASAVEQLTNATADSVLLWRIVNDTLVSDGYYPAGALIKQQTTNEEGRQTISFMNKSGELILQKIQESAANSLWACTYRVYDQFGLLRYVLPPLAVEDFGSPDFGQPKGPFGYLLVESDTTYAAVETASEGRIAFTPNAKVIINEGSTLNAGTSIISVDLNEQVGQSIAYYLDRLMFRYEYDHRHRLIAKKVPDADWEYLVYDARDRLVLTQHANQRANDQWSFVKYDQFNRPIITGEKTITGDLATIRTAVDNATVMHETYDASGLVKYTNASYPTGVTVDDILTVTYYDNYQFTTTTFQLPAGVFNTTDNKILPAQTTYGVNGLTTGSLAKISGTTDQFVSTVNFYDDYYRLAQTVTENHKGGTDRMTPQYHWRGLLMKTYVAHDSPDTAVGTLTITQQYTYDHMGRHLTTTHQINSETVQTIASYSYNALGQLENKSLANGFDETDYAYNIRGWITQMNDPNDTEDHLFEMELKYQNAIHAKFDGNIGEVTWKNPFESATNGFDYQYDERNRISSATGLGEAAGQQLSEVSYDVNGNILNLKRTGTHEDTPNQLYDQLTYSYEEGTNRLAAVADAVDKSTGFDDAHSSGADYVYDANGNLIEDKNKGVTSITYNHLNQPLVVTKSATGEKMEYTYTASGVKLQQKEYRADTLYSTTDYIGGFLYENDKLKLIGHDQGRVIPKTGGGYEYQYHLTDHLGNIRVTFKTEIDVDVYQASMETENETVESPYFYNLDTRSTNASANHTTSGDEAARLDQNALIGPAIALSVIPGDTIDMEVQAYYEGGSGYNSTVTVSSFVTALASVFGGSSGAGGESGAIFDGVNDALAAGAGGIGGSGNDNVPAAYLSYILFDQNYNEIQNGYHEISASASFAHEKLFLDDIAISEPGYLYIYTSMQSDVNLPVYFDDLKVTHTHSPVIQKDDYYPFGLSFNSYTRPAITDQNFKFNAGSELESMTDWYSTPFRKYDPSLGRFHGVDALADLYSSMTPSHFAGNNPIMANDPTGLKINPADEARRGAGCGTCGGGSFFQNTPGHSYGASGISRSARLDAMYAAGKAREAESNESGTEITLDIDQMADGTHEFGFTNGHLTSYSFTGEDGGGFDLTGSDMDVAWAALYFEEGISSSARGSDLYGNMEGTQFWGRSGITSSGKSVASSSSVFDNEPSSSAWIVGDLQRSYYWAQQGDISRAIVYGASGASDALGIAGLGKAAVKASILFAARNAGKQGVSGWVKRKIFNSLDQSIQRKVQSAISNGIVDPVGRQGIIKLTQSEAAATGYSHKVKILGKGGDIRIYGNQGSNGHIFFEKIMGH